jgi:coenzyme F420-0:L-glutamate ligase/coenzyme F420-1:gamma-L-glutamate ligase
LTSAGSTPRLEIWGVEGLPEVRPGDDLGALISAAASLQDGDVLVVTSKIVSKAEGRLAPGTRLDHLAAESARVVARRGDTQIVETHHGFVMAAAGIDASNVPDGMVALLPVDSDASAEAIRVGVRERLGVEVAVIISDTMGRPWRDGVVDTAIGAAGLDVVWDLRGEHDAVGHLLEATIIAVADELASAADLVKGKVTDTPAAVIRGFPYRPDASGRGAKPLIRNASEDMFRLGTREAMAAVVATSAPIDPGTPGAEGVDQAAVERAIDALGDIPTVLTIAADGCTVGAVGDPLSIGHTMGRFAAALAAEGLRTTAPKATDGGAQVRIVEA